MVTKKEILEACQKTAEDLWNNAKDKSVFWFAGFASVRFKGLANKNKALALGFNVEKAYPTGFEINVDEFYTMPDYIKEHGTEDEKASWEQSLTLKEAVAETACKMLKEAGIDCWVWSITD